MRIAAQFVAFFVVLASLAGPCLAVEKSLNDKDDGTSINLSVFFKSNNDDKKKQCTKAVISGVVTQVRFVLLPLKRAPVSIASYKTRLRDRKLSKLFAQNTVPCNQSVDLFVLCRQLN